MIENKDVFVTMRDGIRIALRIYRPDGDKPSPALFAASPYRYDNNELPAQPSFLWRETGPIEWYVEQGYAYIHADVRGSGASEGTYGFLSRSEQEDLYDVIEWIGTQPWCNGKVGGIGQSYFAMSQWFMGVQNPPHLACLGIYDGLNDPYRYMAYPGGIEGNFLYYWFNASVRVANLYPANGDNPRQMADDMLLDIQRHPLYDAYWQERTALENIDKIKVPVFSIGVWAKQDLHLAGNIRGYQALTAPKKLAITPTPTPFSSATDFADIAFHQKYLLPFYDMYLKGHKTSYADRPNVEYTLRGSNVTRAFDSWPPPNLQHQKLYLVAGPSGSVTSLNDGLLGDTPPSDNDCSISYRYPNPSWVLGVVPLGPRGPEPLRCVLTFTSAPLPVDMEVAGEGKLVIYASSTRNDMDFIIKLAEQYPQTPEDRAKGLPEMSTIVSKGWLRASHSTIDPTCSRENSLYYTHEKSTPLEPGKIYKIEIPLQPMGHIFKKGNRLRVELSCGDSPVTDGLFTHIYRPDKIGEDTIYHDKAHASHIILPVLK